MYPPTEALPHSQIRTHVHVSREASNHGVQLRVGENGLGGRRGGSKVEARENARHKVQRALGTVGVG